MIEDVLANRARIQILKYLSKKEWSTRSTLNTKACTNWGYMNQHLKILVDSKILTSKKFGNHILYGYSDSDKGQFMKQFFIKWGLIDASSRN